MAGFSKSWHTCLPRADDICQPQQSGAYFQRRALGSIRIDLEPDPAAALDEADHSTHLDEVLKLSYGKYRKVFRSVDDLNFALPFRRADVDQMAVANVLADPAYHNPPPVECLPFHSLFNGSLEGISCKTDVERRIRPRKCLGRPIDKFREIVKEYRLHLILEGWILR